MENILYFTRKEVAIHNTHNDLWVVIFGHIYDLTDLVHEYGIKSDLIKSIFMFGGKDISHWFDPKTSEICHFIDENTGNKISFFPHLHIPDSIVEGDVDEESKKQKVSWWKDPSRQVGLLTTKSRPIRIINTLTGHTILLEVLALQLTDSPCKGTALAGLWRQYVCSEDTCARIRERYEALGFSPDMNYTWCTAGTGRRAVDMTATLEENGVPDESERFLDVGLPEDLHVPALLLYYNDVITDELL